MHNTSQTVKGKHVWEQILKTNFEARAREERDFSCEGKAAVTHTKPFQKTSLAECCHFLMGPSLLSGPKPRCLAHRITPSWEKFLMLPKPQRPISTIMPIYLLIFYEKYTAHWCLLFLLGKSPWEKWNKFPKLLVKIKNRKLHGCKEFFIRLYTVMNHLSPQKGYTCQEKSNSCDSSQRFLPRKAPHPDIYLPRLDTEPTSF